jgi:hypothetical protein
MQNDEEVFLNSKNAHAWSEVYLEGIGWVTVDPTPGGVQGEFAPDHNQEETTTTTPEETTSFTTTRPSVTNEPEDTEDTQRRDEPESESASGNILNTILLILLILGILGLLFLVLLFYIKKRKDYIAKLHNREWVRNKYPSTDTRANFYWSEILKLSRISRAYIPTSSNTEILVVDELKKIYSRVKLDWDLLASALTKARYKEEEISEEELEILAKAFDLLEDNAEIALGKAGYLRKRILIP